MTHYQELLDELKANSDEAYREFHKKLLCDESANVLGVRVPILRKIAKKYKGREDELFSFPDEYYEVTFVKLTAISALGFDEFLSFVDGCVELIHNWAMCDCFSAKCIAKNKERFLPYISKYSEMSGEFCQRYALTTLLQFYIDDTSLIFETVQRVNTELYYVHMAAAWLIAEVVVKHYEIGVEYLLHSPLDKKTHNKAIQKALESYRLSDERKKYLKGLKK